MMREPMTRVVLRDGVSRDDIDDALFDCGCRLVNVVAPTQSNPGQMIYATGDRQRLVYLVEDGQLGVTYFTGVDEGIAGDLGELRERLPCHGIEDLNELLERSGDDATRIRALSVLVLSVAGDPDDAQVTFVRESLDHESVDVRFAALMALAYVLWPTLRAQVERMAEADEDEMLRLHARRILPLFAG